MEFVQDGRRDQFRSGERREIHETDAVAKLRLRASCCLHRQPRLAHAARAEHRQQAAGGIGQAGGDVGEFGGAADEGGDVRGQAGRGGGSMGEWANGRRLIAAADGLEHGGRFRLRLDAQFGLQDLAALLVLAEGRGAVAGCGVEAHQAAVGGFAEGVEAQPAAGLTERGIPLPPDGQALGQLFQHVGQREAQGLGLHGLPGVEFDRIGQSESGQEVVAVEAGRLVQGDQAVIAERLGCRMVGRRRGEQRPEAHDIGGQPRLAAQEQLIAFGRQPMRAEAAVQVGQHAAQYGAAAFLVEVGPEKGRQGIAAVRLPRHGQIGEQRQ